MCIMEVHKSPTAEGAISFYPESFEFLGLLQWLPFSVVWLFCMLNLILLSHTEHSELWDFTLHSLMSLFDQHWLPSSNTTKDRQCESFTVQRIVSRLRVEETVVYCECVQISVPIFPLLPIFTARNGFTWI